MLDALMSKPQLAPGFAGHVPVGDGHELYVEVHGLADGIPAVFLHGGPGSGFHGEHRALFDDTRFHTMLFDQRGAGRSHAQNRFAANTTQHLIADMETLRKALNFERWLVVGGSWGATLALAYAQAHPDRVSGIVLRATFLGTRAELEQAFSITLPQFYPALHADFLSLLPESERADPLPAYWRRILGPDETIARRFARAWGATERALSSLTAPAQRLDIEALDRDAGPVPASPYMEAFYFLNDCFLGDRPILQNTALLAGIPGIIIQGRYDLLCPPATAHALLSRWPEAQLRIVESAGHLLGEPGIRTAVKQAIEDLATRQ